MRLIAQAYQEKKNYKWAYQWYFKAIGECPEMRDAYIEFARAAYQLADWPTVYYMSISALKITDKSSSFVNMGYAWDNTPYDLLAISCYYLDMMDVSEASIRRALEFEPENNRLKNNLMLILEKKKTFFDKKNNNPA